MLPLVMAICASLTSAQKTKSKTASSAKPLSAIYAVIYDGTGVEPIGHIENGKLVSGGDTGDNYKAGRKFTLIFGGVPNGDVTIKRSNVGKDCGGDSAEVAVLSSKAKLKGFVMGLATDVSSKAKAAGLRRTPTSGERTEIEGLVRAEYAKHKVPATDYKQLHFHNLTAVDVDNDGTPELIGSYWVSPKTNERGLLFFIAEKGSNGKYSFTYSDYQSVTPDKVMSGDLKALDGGTYQTLLLDIFDFDGDGTA